MDSPYTVFILRRGPRSSFYIRQSVLLYDLVDFRSRDIGNLDYDFALKVDRRLGGSANVNAIGKF